MKREDLRRHAFLVTFAMSFNLDSAEEALENYLDSFRKDFERDNVKFKESDLIFIKDIIIGVSRNLEAIDGVIEKYLKGFQLDRISKVALAALRISIYEMDYREDIPSNVSINEAVEITKQYADEKTRKFVNGILGTYIRSK